MVTAMAVNERLDALKPQPRRKSYHYLGGSEELEYRCHRCTEPADCDSCPYDPLTASERVQLAHPQPVRVYYREPVAL